MEMTTLLIIYFLVGVILLPTLYLLYVLKFFRKPAEKRDMKEIVLDFRFKSNVRGRQILQVQVAFEHLERDTVKWRDATKAEAEAIWLTNRQITYYKELLGIK